MRLSGILGAKHRPVELVAISLKAPGLRFPPDVEQSFEAMRVGFLLQFLIYDNAVENSSEARGDVHGRIHPWPVAVEFPPRSVESIKNISFDETTPGKSIHQLPRLMRS